MKGSPLRDFLWVLMLGCLLLLPLFRLTRPSSVALPEPPPQERSADITEAWISLRFSHAPERFSLRLGEELLMEGGGELRAEEDVALRLSDGRVRLQLNLKWPEDVVNGYAELRVEPELLPEQRQGFWARGLVTRFLEFTWTPPSP